MDEVGALLAAIELSDDDAVDSMLKRETLLEELSRISPRSPWIRDCDDSLERGVLCVPLGAGETVPVPPATDPDVGEP